MRQRRAAGPSSRSAALGSGHAAHSVFLVCRKGLLKRVPNTGRCFPGGSGVKNLPAVQETQV